MPLSLSLSGSQASQRISDQSTIVPLAGATIGDDTGQTETVTVTLSAAANGTLTNLGSGTFDPLRGVYTDSGSAAAVTRDLDALTFTPTPQQVAPGQTVTTVFRISDTDAAGSSVSDSTTSVIVTAGTLAPTIGNTVASQAATDHTSIAPFAWVVIGDLNVGQTETLTVKLSAAANGGLTNLGAGSYNAGSGIYTVLGSSRHHRPRLGTVGKWFLVIWISAAIHAAACAQAGMMLRTERAFISDAGDQPRRSPVMPTWNYEREAIVIRGLWPRESPKRFAFKDAAAFSGAEDERDRIVTPALFLRSKFDFSVSRPNMIAREGKRRLRWKWSQWALFLPVKTDRTRAKDDIGKYSQYNSRTTPVIYKLEDEPQSFGISPIAIRIVVSDSLDKNVRAAKGRHSYVAGFVSDPCLSPSNFCLLNANPHLSKGEQDNRDIRPLDIGSPRRRPNVAKPVHPQFPAILLGCILMAAAYQTGSREGRAWTIVAILLAASAWPVIFVGSLIVQSF
ncbi:hypothetical protein [Rhodopila sp.]|uniref:hypothetical protein n=1 Tax=Rhodopila sp. TaxID=2480087 RepID=UPI003D0D8F03